MPQGDIDIITTDPTGGQKTYTVTTRPQQTWGHTLTQFYQAHPDIDPSTLKLYAFDRTGEPLSHLNEESDSYTGSPIVVQQRKRVGLYEPFTVLYLIVKWIIIFPLTCDSSYFLKGFGSTFADSVGQFQNLLL